jgi:hypothetical protein
VTMLAANDEMRGLRGGSYQWSRYIGNQAIEGQS